MRCLRSKLKVPKYRLFYFESDRTLSMLPSTKETVVFITLIPSKFNSWTAWQIWTLRRLNDRTLSFTNSDVRTMMSQKCLLVVWVALSHSTYSNALRYLEDYTTQKSWHSWMIRSHILIISTTGNVLDRASRRLFKILLGNRYDDFAWLAFLKNYAPVMIPAFIQD